MVPINPCVQIQVGGWNALVADVKRFVASGDVVQRLQAHIGNVCGADPLRTRGCRRSPQLSSERRRILKRGLHELPG